MRSVDPGGRDWRRAALPRGRADNAGRPQPLYTPTHTRARARARTHTPLGSPAPPPSRTCRSSGPTRRQEAARRARCNAHAEQRQVAPTRCLPKHGQPRRSVVTSPPAAQQRAQAADACALLRGGGAAPVSRATRVGPPPVCVWGGPSQSPSYKRQGLWLCAGVMPLLGSIGGKYKAAPVKASSPA